MKYIWRYKTPEGFGDLVMGGDDGLTGYGGGLANKTALLRHEMKASKH